MKCIKALLIGMVILLPAFSDAGWNDEACVSSTKCKEISKNYTEPYCISGAVDNANYCIRSKNTNILSSFSSTNNLKEAVEKYCGSLLGDLGGRIYFSRPLSGKDSWDWQQTFDSHQSLFLQALCGSFKDKDGNTPFLNGGKLSEAYQGDIVKILGLKQLSKRKDLCSLSDDNTLQNCDLSIYATKIFDGIMSDLFKIKYAQVLHVDTVDNFNAEDKIKDFLNGYYSIENDEYDKRRKDYSKTISVIKSDQKYYKNMLDKIKLIDNSKLASLAQNSGCPENGNMAGMDFIACALHSSQGKGSTAITPSFVTMVYNEFLQYQQFIIYYINRLDNKMVHNSNISDTDRLKYSSMLSDIQAYLSMQKEAFQLAEHNLEEFNMTYPLHIWFLLYTEKVDKFRKKLAEIITPFYSLSEKLQNVQLPS